MSLFPKLDHTTVSDVTFGALKDVTQISQFLMSEKQKTNLTDWNDPVFQKTQKLLLRVRQARTSGTVMENLGYSTANIQYKALNDIHDAILYGIECPAFGQNMNIIHNICTERLLLIEQYLESLLSFISRRTKQ